MEGLFLFLGGVWGREEGRVGVVVLSHAVSALRNRQHDWDVPTKSKEKRPSRSERRVMEVVIVRGWGLGEGEEAREAGRATGLGIGGMRGHGD